MILGEGGMWTRKVLTGSKDKLRVFSSVSVEMWYRFWSTLSLVSRTVLAHH